MVNRTCKYCRYWKKSQRIDRYGDNSYFKYCIYKYCANKNSIYYKKDIYSDYECEHYVTRLPYRLYNRFYYFLYKIYAKIKGIEIKEVKK